MLISSTFVAEVDELKNHFDVRSIFSNEMGRALAKKVDKHLLQLIVKASRATANISGETGAGTEIVDADADTNMTSLIESVFEAIQKLDENDVPSAIINKLEDVIDDPQVKNNDTIMKLSSNDNNSMQSPKSPAQYSSTPCSDNPKFMPALGEHSREILLENGFSDEKIRELSENQIIAVR